MRNRILLAAGVSLLAGCATKEMKSTPFYEGGEVEYVGEASDRVNLWPVAYWRNPVGSVAWPLVSFSDDHFALRPIYSQYKQTGRDGAWDEFNFAWPIAQADTKHDDYHVFPVFWGKDYQAVFPIYWNGPHYNSLFPIWYYGSTTNSWHFNTLAGLAGAYSSSEELEVKSEELRTDKIPSKGGYRASWAFPLWYEDNTGLFTTLLYGQTKDSHWVFPLWYKGEKAFISPFYAQGEEGGGSGEGGGSERWWAVPALLSWGGGWSTEKNSRNDGTILLDLGGWYYRKDSNGEFGDWWAFPFIRREWYALNDPKREPTTETQVACYLAGWRTSGEKLKSLYVFPLLYWEDDGSWLTPLGGQLNCNGTTNTVITPIVGVTSGKQTGGWVFPIWSHEKDVDFDEKVALIDSPTLPDCIKVGVHTNTLEKSEYFGKTYLSGEYLRRTDETVILFHDANHSIRGWNSDCWYDSPTNEYEISECCKRGHKLLFNYESDRTVTFDLKTKAKLSDEEESEASLLLWLYQYEWNRDRTWGSEYTRHRVLWRLWDWEEEDGDVSLDVFPGFTYDARRDGYTKTSLLWRLFRYERNPNAGTSIDLLFLPIWR